MKACLILLCLAVAAPGIEIHAHPHSARRFVEGIYRAYEHPASPADPQYLGKLAPQVFSPSLLHLIRRGQSDSLDDDPICECQDPDGLHLTHLVLTPSSTGRILATATLTWYPPAASTTLSMHLSLLHTRHGWRIDDISTPRTPSLRTFLRESLAPPSKPASNRTHMPAARKAFPS